MRNDLEEIPYSDSSRMEPKRSHHWLTESSESEQFSNKRQVVENDAAAPPLNLSEAWDNSLVSTQITHSLFDPTNARSYQPTEEQNNNVLAIGLPVVHTVHGSSFNLDTTRNVEVSQVPESGTSRLFETGLPYNSSQDTSLSFGQTCNNVDKSFIFPGPLGSMADGNFMRNFNHEGDGLVPIGDAYDTGDRNVLSAVHPFEKGGENFVLMGQSFRRADCNVFSASPSYDKGQENFMSLLSCDKVPENLFVTGSNYLKENVNVLSGRRSPFMEGGEVASMVPSQSREDQNSDRIGHEVTSKTFSFGDYQNETTMGSSVSVANSFKNPASSKDSLHVEAVENMSSASPSNASPRADTLVVPKSKTPKTAKKGSSNTFPSNVKSLLSTGMFDGITVKYYSWSHEKTLRGIIKGTGYLCGCGNCNFNKVINAYELEQHANCKSRHPTNHIHFENGKTLYGVVQELKNTPQEKLFDTIQTITGSNINLKNFNTWKASYEVASLELQRIYGKDAATLASREGEQAK